MSVSNAEYKKEISLLFKLCWPTVVSYFLTLIYPAMTLMFVGKYLTTDDFDAVLLATLTCNLTGFSIIFGLVSAMETLCSQAYGALNWYLYGLTVQRAIIVTFLAWFAISILWIFMGDLFLLCHQPREASIKAGIICKIYILMVPAFSGVEIIRRFLGCQEIVIPILKVSMAIFLIFHPIMLCLTFAINLFEFDNGKNDNQNENNNNSSFRMKSIEGAAIINTLSVYLVFICLLIYMKIAKPHNPLTWQNWTRNALKWHGNTLASRWLNKSKNNNKNGYNDYGYQRTRTNDQSNNNLMSLSSLLDADASNGSNTSNTNSNSSNNSNNPQNPLLNDSSSHDNIQITQLTQLTPINDIESEQERKEVEQNEITNENEEDIDDIAVTAIGDAIASLPMQMNGLDRLDRLDTNEMKNEFVDDGIDNHFSLRSNSTARSSNSSSSNSFTSPNSRQNSGNLRNLNSLRQNNENNSDSRNLSNLLSMEDIKELRLELQNEINNNSSKIESNNTNMNSNNNNHLTVNNINGMNRSNSDRSIARSSSGSSRHGALIRDDSFTGSLSNQSPAEFDDDSKESKQSSSHDSRDNNNNENDLNQPGLALARIIENEHETSDDNLNNSNNHRNSNYNANAGQSDHFDNEASGRNEVLNLGLERQDALHSLEDIGGDISNLNELNDYIDTDVVVHVNSNNNNNNNVVDFGLKKYLSFALACVLSNCAEWWCFETTTFLVGLLGKNSLAAHGVFATIIPIKFCVPLGLSMSGAMRVGTLVGKEEYHLASKISKLLLKTSICESLVCAIILLLVSKNIGYAFSNDESVIGKCANLAPFAAFMMMSDSVQGTMQGVLRGYGLQSKAAIAVFVACWLTVIPLGAMLGLWAEMGVYGFWLGICVGYAILAVWLFVIYKKYKFE